MGCNNLFSMKGFFALVLMSFSMLCSCRKISPPQNALAIWQNDWQGIAMTATSHSDGLNLFLPPAPVYFAATKSDLDPAPQIRRKDLGPASDALEDYCHAWSEILQRELPLVMDFPPAFSLPPSPWMMVLTEEDFRATVRFLYEALGKEGLTSEQKHQLELLFVFHEQQRQFSEVLRFINKINRSQDCDLEDALHHFRIFREFQQKFAGCLEETLMAELLLPAKMTDETLQPFIALPQLERPPLCLPSLWMAVRETDNTPISAAGKTLADWRNLNPVPLRFAAIREDLQQGLPQTSDGFTWLIMSFDSPQPDSEAEFYLAFMPIPEQTEIFLNGIAQSCTANQPFAIKIKSSETPDEEQLLALRFPNASLGAPLWPPWLTKKSL